MWNTSDGCKRNLQTTTVIPQEYFWGKNKVVSICQTCLCSDAYLCVKVQRKVIMYCWNFCLNIDPMLSFFLLAAIIFQSLLCHLIFFLYIYSNKGLFEALISCNYIPIIPILKRCYSFFVTFMNTVCSLEFSVMAMTAVIL